MKTLSDLNRELTHSLGAFERWMNRPLARVQVYTWRLACQLEREQQRDYGSSIRWLPAYRAPQIKQWRNDVAALLRSARRGGRIPLPIYSESTQQYVFEQERKAV